jgi:hypothetical protein
VVAGTFPGTSTGPRRQELRLPRKQARTGANRDGPERVEDEVDDAALCGSDGPDASGRGRGGQRERDGARYRRLGWAIN